MNLPTNCKTFLAQLFQSQKKSDFFALLGLNAKKSRREILPEITNSEFMLRIVLPPSNHKGNTYRFGDAGLELATSWSQTKHSSHLS